MISKTQLKYIQSLGQKKHRDEERLFIAEGPKLVKELLQNENTIPRYLYALQEWIDDNKPSLSGFDVTEVTESELQRISQLKTPHQVFAVFSMFDAIQADARNKITLVLDGIQDPGNMGTIVRIADWYAIPQIVCSPDCADVYNPKVVQATMGSIARGNCCYTELSGWLDGQSPTRIYASLLEGKDVTKMSPIREGIIMIGNESRGINADLLERANEKITIPRKGKAESLNAAVATGIILSYLT